MSGIAVIYNLDGRPADGLLLDRMLSAIAHRGRDGMGRWIGGPVAIGHAMLHTTLESTREPQPLCDDSLCLTFDGRVDNREELAAAFKSAGIELKGDGDAELVLRAYQLWGDESPRRILGDFAYALWDGRNRRLLCARDPMGVKPLYYHIGAGFFLCGSELHQLLQDPRVRRAPNEPMVAEYLLGAFSTREDTLFSGLMRLAGGDLLIVRPDGVTKRTWLALDPGKKISYRTDDEYAEHLRGLVEEAVRCRMRSVGGVAAELSGGIDSSAVVGVVQKLMREHRVPAMPFETFSLSFSGAAADESAYVNERRQDVADQVEQRSAAGSNHAVMDGANSAIPGNAGHTQLRYVRSVEGAGRNPRIPRMPDRAWRRRLAVRQPLPIRFAAARPQAE